MMPPELKPRLYHGALPENEREHSRDVVNNLHNLDRMIDDFKAASKLANWSAQEIRKQPSMSDDRFLLMKWSNIGARAGAMYLYGFHRITNAINTSLAKCPSLLPHYDRKELGKAWKSFDAAFPSFADVRLAAAHPGELFNTAQKASEHAVKDGLDIPGFIKALPGAEVILDGGMINGAFTCTIDGKAVSYSPNAKSEKTLIGVVEQIWEALTPAFRHTEALYEKQRQEKQ